MLDNVWGIFLWYKTINLYARKYNFAGSHFKSYACDIKSRFPAIRLTFSQIVRLYNVFVSACHVFTGRRHC